MATHATDVDEKQRISAWQKTIENAFTDTTGLFAPRVVHLRKLEQLHQSALVQEIFGFDRLIGAFQDFAIQTIDEAYAHGSALNKFRLLVLVATLRRYRAAICALYDGYYFDACSLLRGVFENNMYVGALLHNFVGEWAMWDSKDMDIDAMSTEQLFKIIRKNVKQHDKLLLDKMRGKDSGLALEEQKAIEKLVWTLHSHVHRTESALHFSLKEWRESKRPPTLQPRLNPAHAHTVGFAFETTAWLTLRLLPFLSNPNLFSDDWHEKYRVLDEGFSTYMAFNVKPIQFAVRALAAKRFTFEWPNKAVVGVATSEQ